MSPAEDANLLFGLVRRYLRSLAMTLDPQFPDEDWGYTAQQAVEKLLKAWIVLSDQRPPRSHELLELAALAEVELPAQLLGLQTYAVEARYEEGPFPLPAAREGLLSQIEQLLASCVEAVDRLD